MLWSKKNDLISLDKLAVLLQNVLHFKIGRKYKNKCKISRFWKPIIEYFVVVCSWRYFLWDWRTRRNAIFSIFVPVALSSHKMILREHYSYQHQIKNLQEGTTIATPRIWFVKLWMVSIINVKVAAVNFWSPPKIIIWTWCKILSSLLFTVIDSFIV